MTTTNDPPEMPNLGGKIPQPWNELITHLGKVEPGSQKGQELAARLQVWLLFTDLRVRQLEASATRKQARALNAATWVLAFATLALIAATFIAPFLGPESP